MTLGAGDFREAESMGQYEKAKEREDCMEQTLTRKVESKKQVVGGASGREMGSQQVLREHCEQFWDSVPNSFCPHPKHPGDAATCRERRSPGLVPAEMLWGSSRRSWGPPGPETDTAPVSPAAVRAEGCLLPPSS